MWERGWKGCVARHGKLERTTLRIGNREPERGWWRDGLTKREEGAGRAKGWRKGRRNVRENVGERSMD